MLLSAVLSVWYPQSSRSFDVQCLQEVYGFLDALPSSRVVLFDVTPRQLLCIAGHRLPERYKRRLRRYRYGPGSFKVDFALSGPIPWKAAECLQAGTVHIGGTFAEIAASERQVWQGQVPERPYIIVAQQITCFARVDELRCLSI